MEINFHVSEEDLERNTGGGTFGPGNYEFQVGDAFLFASSKKTPGIKLTLLASHEGRDYKVFDNLWLTEPSKWRYARFLDAIGLDPTESLDTDDLMGKVGRFRVKAKEDSKYVEVDQYHTQAEAPFEEMGPFPPAGDGSGASILNGPTARAQAGKGGIAGNCNDEVPF